MYYLFSESGAFIDDYEKLETGLSARESISDSILFYSGEYTKPMDVWEHGIEVMAPSSESREFVYWASYPRSDHKFSRVTFENALEGLKALVEGYKDPLSYGIEERITITHKVKL